MNPPTKRIAARSTGVSPPSQRTRRIVLPSSLLHTPASTPASLRSFHRGTLQQLPRPGFTLEELQEIENDPEAVDEDNEDNEDNVGAWRNYLQSQQASQNQPGQLTQSMPYESPYSTQNLAHLPSNVLPPRYQATASQIASQAPQAPAVIW